VNKLREIMDEVVKEVVRQEPNPKLRKPKVDRVKRSIDTTYTGERDRGRKR